MTARDMAVQLLDQSPVSFTGPAPGHKVYPGHRHSWVQRAFTILRELALVGHENSRAHMDRLNSATWDLTGSGDALLFAWSKVYDKWALEVAEQNAALAAAKRGDA